VLSATVIGRDLMESEMASKVALLLGSSEGLDWLDARENLSGCLILEDGNFLKSVDFANNLMETQCNTQI
jgi:thiamine biosynthesis lipoprotein ApbE